MAGNRRTFFERLTGAVAVADDYEFDEERHIPVSHTGKGAARVAEIPEEDPAEGQLAVDVYQTPSHIIVKTMVAGVKPEDLDVSITRDMVTIKGKRERQVETNDQDHFFQELYWGAFSRTILLPQEVEVEGAEAVEKHGLLMIKLPKIDKSRQAKLKVKSS